MTEPKIDCEGIIEKYLIDHGYDGLYECDTEFDDGFVCGCEIEEIFLFCCGENFGRCSPGYKTECDCGEDHDYHIRPEKEKTK